MTVPVSESAVKNQSQGPANSPGAISAVSASDPQATSSALVEKYEIGSGENKVNVRIFKEPPTRPIIVEPSRDVEVKQVDEDTLIVRMNNKTTFDP